MKNRYTIDEFRAEYPNNDACLEKLWQLRYGSNFVCPKCENTSTYKRVKGRRSYQCQSCANQIYPTQGTIFEKSTTPLTYWFYAIFLQTTTRNGVAAKELERQLKICYKTALRMSHQIKMLMANKKVNKLKGVVSADESFIGGLNKNRHSDKKVPESQGRSCKDKTPVFGMVDLNGNVSAHVVSDTQGNTLKSLLDKHVDKENSIVITDEWLGYKQLENNQYKHVVINHLSGEYVRGAFHNNRIEGVWSQLKRTIKGTHVQVSRKHLQKYVDEVAFRYTNRERQDEMFELILKNVV
ncbi:Transposase zinc-ribbon domain-containing protein [Hydrobacter penzbergensis]|uniref:Transposase zinc-ribbon domain-containing protein n=1 Tax=Hydrobacter penzbergensis TaxID=1235997 RepID=A0A8X8IC61_9BACT|nr:IS1595 family transposase [Hydrobacter penzbergensis]SDW84003.1 Transposase zinc-ribbon domain-containing protein [Hydrobacter penzbergensis]